MEMLKRDTAIETLTAEIAAIISDITEISVNWIKETTPLSELGIDSLEALRIIAAVEKKYRIEVPEEHIGQVTVVGDIVRMVADSI